MADKTQDLPGVEGEGVSRKKIAAIEKAFDELLAHREKRMAHGEKEAEAQAKLIQLFHKHNVTVYNYDEVKYKLSGKEKIVKAPKDVELETAAGSPEE